MDLNRMRNLHLQKLCKQTKSIIKNEVSMKSSNEKEQLYLKLDASGVRLGAGLLQMRGGKQFPKDRIPETQHCS